MTAGCPAGADAARQPRKGCCHRNSRATPGALETMAAAPHGWRSARHGAPDGPGAAAFQAGPERPGLPKELVGQLRVWNDRYQQVISADLPARRSEPLASLIQDLDREGLALAD